MTNTSNFERVFVALILAAYLAVGGLFAVRTPDWQTPDEPAHYNYVRQVAEGQNLAGCCPEIALGDWDSDYLEQLKSARFAPELLANLDSVQYEDHQPPLYYLLASVVYRLTNGSLTALRLFSVVIGLVIVLCAYGVGKTLLPERPQVALGAAAFVAFQPMHIAILASVNNDALGWAVAALILLASMVYMKQSDLTSHEQGEGNESPSPIMERGWGEVRPWQLGLLVGIGLITKATAYPMAAVAGLAILLRWWRSAEKRSIPPLQIGKEGQGVRLLRDIALFLIPAVALGMTWWLRNFSVYGFPDFLGLRAHDAVVVGQPRTAELIAQVGWNGYLSRALNDTFNSFWGQFGWMALPLRGNASVDWIYPAFLALLVVGLSGAMIAAFRPSSVPDDQSSLRSWRLGGWLLLLTALLSLAAYAYYNTEFLQFQGRYTFPLLIPLGIALALGVDTWRGLLLSRWPMTRWLTPLAFCTLAALDVWLLWTVIAPNLAPLSS